MILEVSNLLIMRPNLIVISVILVGYVCGVIGYGTGAPNSQCESLSPVHGVPPKFPNDSPYQIITSHTSVQGGDKVKVRLASTGNSIPFKGFLARAHSDELAYAGITNQIGHVLTQSNENQKKTKYLDCFGVANSALTHADNTPTTSVEFYWIAPNVDATFRILATFVKDKETFWIAVPSHEIRVSKNPNYNNKPTDDPPIKFPHTDSGDDGTKNDPGSYAGCGSEKSCIGFPEGCKWNGTDCEMITTWQYDPSTGDYRFNVFGQLRFEEGMTQGHVSTGLSFDDKMGQDSVIGCVYQNGIVKPKSYYNLPDVKQNSAFKEESVGLSAIKGGSYTNGIMSCEFTRKGLLIDTTSELGRNFDLNKDLFYIMMARASSMSINKDNGREKLGYHKLPTDRYVTKKAYQLRDITTNQVQDGGKSPPPRPTFGTIPTSTTTPLPKKKNGAAFVKINDLLFTIILCIPIAFRI